MVTFRKRKYEDFGLDNKGAAGEYLALNKDGSFNIRKTHVPFLEKLNFFHSLVSMSWRKFFGLIVAGYFAVNLLFASLYMLAGVEHLTITRGLSPSGQFMEAFFFSAQTITTLGYGRVAPTGLLTNSIAALESMLGLLAFALATGLLYGRFSRPSARIRYSSMALIAPYQDITGFMFRVANIQRNQLMEVEATVSVSMKREGSGLRDFHQLELERRRVVFFPSMWTVVHPITPDSPLHGMGREALLEKDAEFIVLLRAFDESSSQTVYSRSSYKAGEIEWGRKFVYLLEAGRKGPTVNISRIDETEEAPLITHKN